VKIGMPPPVYVWITRSADYPDTQILETWLSEEERVRAHRFIHAHHRNDFIVAHVLKRRCLAEVLQQHDTAALQFSKGPTGKPCVVGETIHFNLSHSNGVVAVAVSEFAPCGVDVETHRQINTLSALIEKTMTSDEQQQINMAPSVLKAFVDRWVLKEAFLKCTGQGLAVPMNSICTIKELKKGRGRVSSLRGISLFFKRFKEGSLAASCKREIAHFKVIQVSPEQLLNNVVMI